MSTTDHGGGLTPGGRFDRMEQALTRIEEKLDRKIDLRDFVQLEARVGMLESGDTPVGKILLEQFRELQAQMRELSEHGSRNAQEAYAKAHELDKQVAVLQQASETNQALVTSQRDRILNRWRWYGAAVALGELALAAALYFH